MPSGSEQHVILVDSQDNPLGTLAKLEAHQQGLRHRAFSVFVFRNHFDTWECLLQQRHPDKYHCGNLWTNTCCSHPYPNEKTQDAAQRRLREEMGIHIPLTFIDKFHYVAECNNGLTENEIDHVFIGVSDNNLNIVINPKEVINYKWVAVDVLQSDLKRQPTHYTPWLSQSLEIAITGLPS